MKKIYSFLLIAVTTFGYGQLSENFDAGTTLPAGWATFRGTNGLGTAFDWTFIASVRANTAPNLAFVRYEAQTGGSNEDWLVSPLIDLTNYSSSSLTFYSKQQYTDPYGTVYEIRVSTASQTTHADFTSVEAYGEADFLLTNTAMDAGDLKTVDLSAYDGQQIYVAFVMTQDDGDNWFLDTINVTGTLSNLDFNSQTTSVYPNPTNGLVTIQFNEEIESVKVIGLLGNVLKTYTNTNSIDLSDLNSGSYIVSIVSTSGNVVTKKIVKN
jgi:hypothetical protein